VRWLESTLDTTIAVWLLTGLVAGIADYGLGLGFGLAASILLASLLGYDPRTVAAAAATAQIATALPAVAVHRKSGNVGNASGVQSTAATIAVSSSIAAALTALAASGLPRDFVLSLYTIALAVLLAAMAVAVLRPHNATIEARRSRVVAATAGCIAGVEKALIGGGFSALIAAAQTLSGVSIKTAIALTPLVKLPAFIAVAAVYGIRGYLELPHAAALTAGALASLPLAAATLRRVGDRHLAAAVLAALLAAFVASVLRLVRHA